MHKTFIGIDAGGTNLDVGLVSFTGCILKLTSRLTQNYLGPKKVAANVIAAVAEILGSAKNCQAIGVGWPSRANMSLSGQRLRKILQNKFHLPTWLENDANFYALGEALVGAGQRYNIVAGLTFGTGIGCGLVIQKKIYCGQGAASEFGHTLFKYDGPPCSCGSRGCFELYASSKGLKKLIKKHRLKAADGQQLYELALAGDKRTLILWQEFGFFLGLGLVSLINAYDPAIILLGGKIARAWRFFYPTMIREIKKRSLIKHCPIKPSRLANAAVIGGALYARQQMIK